MAMRKCPWTRCKSGSDQLIAQSAKAAYVSTIAYLRRRLQGGRIFRFLERRRKNRWALWFRSLFAVYDFEDMTKLDVPWWSLAAMNKVESFLKDRKNARVFEYGSGASTVWLAKRSGSVTSVEHDENWARLVSSHRQLSAAVEVHCVPGKPILDVNDAAIRSHKAGWKNLDFSEYVNALASQKGLFDLIVIDGRARSECLQVAAAKLKPDGMIVFDNSKRDRYRASIENSGLNVERAGGLTVALPYFDETALLTFEKPQHSADTQ